MMTAAPAPVRFPLIGVGSSLGAWVGSLRVGQLLEMWGARGWLAVTFGLRSRLNARSHATGTTEL
jgi:hypothetical protein